MSRGTDRNCTADRKAPAAGSRVQAAAMLCRAPVVEISAAV